jgi:uncharacterized protein
MAASDPDLEEWRERLAERVADQPGDDGSHDVHHCQRVWRLCQRIADGEGVAVDRLVLLAAAYLHDVVNPPKDSPERNRASRLSAQRAAEWLAVMGFPEAKLDGVRHAIEAHSFSAGIAPETVEARILQDADRMEALGAIGLARVFYVAGRLRSRLFDPADPLSARRAPDDRRFAVDHFKLKLLRLPASMRTRTGRRLAAERAAFLERYLEQLARELAV